MIPCLECGGRTRVINSRRNASGVRRRRQCDCGHKFTTIEQPIEICQGMWIRRLVEADISHAQGYAQRLRDIAESLDDIAEAAGA